MHGAGDAEYGEHDHRQDIEAHPVGGEEHEREQQRPDTHICAHVAERFPLRPPHNLTVVAYGGTLGLPAVDPFQG